MLYLSKILLLVCAIACIGDVWAQANKSGSFKTVVIDAGHGGKDPGAIGKLVKEKDIVLNVALKVGEYLKKELPELEVIYTRKNDIFVELDERAEIANHAKADLFVSIHANSINNPKIHGAETFVLGLHRSQENLEVAKKENSVIVLEDDYTTKYEGFDPNSTESYIIFELMQNIYLDQSLEAASIIQEQFEERVGRHNRGVKQAGFLVLRKTAMPSILVELGFLSNKNEEKFMSEEEGQTYLASAIFRSIRDYRNKFEARNSIVKQIEKDVIEFRIQIAASNSELKKDAAPYKLFNDVWMFKDGKQYKYTTGLASDYNTISRELEKVKKKVPDCFIVAFKNGEKVPVSSVR